MLCISATSLNPGVRAWRDGRRPFWTFVNDWERCLFFPNFCFKWTYVFYNLRFIETFHATSTPFLIIKYNFLNVWSNKHLLSFEYNNFHVCFNIWEIYFQKRAAHVASHVVQGKFLHTSRGSCFCDFSFQTSHFTFSQCSLMKPQRFSWLQ